MIPIPNDAFSGGCRRDISNTARALSGTGTLLEVEQSSYEAQFWGCRLVLPRWSKCILLPTTRNASLDRSTDSVARSSLTDEFARWTPADSLPRHTTPQLAFAPAFLRLSLSRPDRPFSAPCCPQHLCTYVIRAPGARREGSDQAQPLAGPSYKPARRPESEDVRGVLEADGSATRRGAGRVRGKYQTRRPPPD